MIVVGYLAILVLLCFFSALKFKRIINIVSIFSSIWCIFGIISCFGLYGVRIPTLKIHLYAYIFVILTSIIIIMFLKYTKEEHTDSNINYHIYDKRMKIVLIVTLILIIPLTYKIFMVLLSSGSFTQIRNFYFSGEIFASIYSDLLFRTIPMASLTALSLYYVFSGFEQEKYKHIIYSLLIVILITLLNGGRYALIQFIYSIIIMLISSKSNLIHNFIFSKKLKKVLIFGIFVMLIITVARGQEIIKNIIIYFSGSLSFLDLILEHPYNFGLETKTYGYLTFGFLLEPFILALKALGLTTLKVPSYEFNIYCQTFYSIAATGQGMLFNANTSILYYFLRDFGILGIFLGAILFGATINFTYNRWKKGDKFYGLLFLYSCYALFNTLMTNSIFGPAPIIIIFIFFIIFGKRRVKLGRWKW